MKTKENKIKITLKTIIFSAFGIWKIVMSIGNSFEDARAKDDIKIIRTV